MARKRPGRKTGRIKADPKLLPSMMFTEEQPLTNGTLDLSNDLNENCQKPIEHINQVRLIYFLHFFFIFSTENSLQFFDLLFLIFITVYYYCTT